MTLLILLLLCAPSLGSFFGVLVTRLPVGRGFVLERSRCDACGRQLRFWEMVPILSWCFLLGRCPRCRASVSVLYPVIEIAAVLIVVVAARAVTGTALIAACIKGWLLLVMTFLIWSFALKVSASRSSLVTFIGLGWLLWLYELYANFRR